MTAEFAELRRRHAALTPFALRFLPGGPGEDPYIALAGEDGFPLSESGFDAVLLFAEIAAADLPALLDAAAERDALTVVQPCVMKLGEVYDFAWCETHDRTFALGGTCDHAGLSHVDYLDNDGRKQRGRAVRVEMERDALAAKVERVRALASGMGVPRLGAGTDRDSALTRVTLRSAGHRIRRALDEDAQP